MTITIDSDVGRIGGVRWLVSAGDGEYDTALNETFPTLSAIAMNMNMNH